MLRWEFAVACVVFAAQAHAEPSWRAGLDVHGTDAALGGRRPIGLAGRLRWGAMEAAVVVDPLVFVLGWEMLDVTAGRWIAGDRAEVLAGWRQTSGRLGTGRRYDEAVLLGADWVAPLSGRFRFAFGLEFETSIWRHGGNIDSDTIQVFPFTTDIAARMEFLLHARFELTGLL
jgi:hypothetical protein